MRFFRLQIPLLIIGAALCWAFISDPFITKLAAHKGLQHEDLFRSLNDFIVVSVISLALYPRVYKQQRALRKAADKYRRLFEEIPTPLFIFDAEDYSFLMVNDACTTQYAYSREELLKMKVTDIRPASELEAFYEANKHITSQYLNAGRWIHQDRDGKQFYVRVFAHTTQFEGRAARQVVVINIDQKVKNEMALQDQAAELEERLEQIKHQNEKLKEIAWIQSHQVRVPVANLMGLIQLLEHNHEDPIVQKMQQSCLQLDEMIRDITRKTEYIK